MRLILLLGLFALTASAQETYAPFRPDLPAGAAYMIDARKLHPTQFSHGWREVVYKAAKINAMSPAEVTAYLQKKDVPVVIGPGGVPYMTDGHHTLRSLIESTAPDKTAYGHILANWSDLDATTFWARMEANNYTYLKDATGRIQAPATLPASLLVMQRDPWRGLAWGVMEAGGFHERKGVFFQEFRWADHFRDKVRWDDADDEAFDDAVMAACVLAQSPAAASLPGYRSEALQPRVITEAVRHDTDDPAIWINAANPAESLILGTDKNNDGALYVWGLDGKIRHDKVVRGLIRPNNVDIAYGVMLGGRKTDIAVVTERYAHRLRAYRLPDMVPVDNGGIPVFEREPARDCMGIALYTRATDGAVFAIVSRSDHQAPVEGYLHQYRLVDDGNGVLRGVFTRAFGTWSGANEIEAIAVDQELGYVYYADESHGIRKYHADPAAADADRQIAVFGLEDFADDREGISIYRTGPGTGYILVSNQQDNSFNLYPREGAAGDPHEHRLIKSVPVTTIESDGSDITNVALPGFPNGLLVAMSNGKVFHYYAWEDIATKAGLKKARDGGVK